MTLSAEQTADGLISSARRSCHPATIVRQTSLRYGRPVATARLVVREGTANIAELPPDKPRVNIGRVVDLYRSKGLHRRNDLASVAQGEVNRSVSRGSMRSREVHRDTRGTKLEPGDEIRVGQAVMTLETD